VIDCINRKHSLFREYKSGSIEFDVYNTFKNYVTQIIRRSKERFYHGKFSSCNGDSKATWRTIDVLTGRKVNRKVISEIDVRGRKLTDECEVAEYFNNFFCNIAVDINNSIPLTGICPLQYLGERATNTMFTLPSTTSDVISVIDNLRNKSCRLYEVPVFIYKYCSDLLSPVISHLFNMSLSQVILYMPITIDPYQCYQYCQKSLRN